MTDTQRTDIEARTEPAPPASAGEMLGRFAEKLSAAASVRTVFGDPIERGGVTIIPVAKTGMGFGLGIGRSRKGDGSRGDGSGGGGGGSARPYGFIQITDGDAVFKPIRDPWVDIFVPIAAAVSAAFLPKLAKRLKRVRED